MDSSSSSDAMGGKVQGRRLKNSRIIGLIAEISMFFGRQFCIRFGRFSVTMADLLSGARPFNGSERILVCDRDSGRICAADAQRFWRKSVAAVEPGGILTSASGK